MVVVFHILYINLFFVESSPSVEYIGQHDRGGQRHVCHGFQRVEGG